MPLAACAGGTATIDLRYNDATNVVTAIVATNGSGGPMSLTITPPGAGAPISRTWQTGTTETLAVPPGFPFDVDALGALTARFGVTFSGPAMAT